MHEDGQKLLNLMFLPQETVCVSNSKFGYHSIPLQNALSGKVTLIPPLEVSKTWEEQARYCDSSELTLIALNPIEGYRRDCNVKAYRNFLIELDTGSIDEQINYLKKSGIPYSAMIFSGSKSVHTLISLDQDFPDEKSYRKIAQWILNILPLCDQNCKNPSRQIRIPGAEREPGKFQKLLEFKGKVTTKELADWLKKHPGSCPQEKPKRKPAGEPDFSLIKPWALKLLKDGIVTNRNHNWFSIAVEFASAGIQEEEAIDMLYEYFNEERDFKEKEWLTAIHSGYNYLSTK